MTKFIKNRIRTLSLTAAFMMAAPVSAWAGNWTRSEEGSWFYEENGILETGWQYIGNEWYYFDFQGAMMTGWVKTPEQQKWYYLDEENGNWEPKPALTEKAACCLLENAITEAGLYQNENRQVQYKVDYSEKDRLKISIGYEKMPGIFTTINSYEVDRKNRTAESVMRDQFYDL